jgi:tripartite motif-containing protein 71
VYVADYNNDRILKFDKNGTLITKWGSSGDGDGEFGSLDDIAFDRSGNLYVADSGNNRIQKFDKNGTFITKWETILPQGIGVNSLRNVYVSDSRKYIKIFGPSFSDREQ